MFLHIHHLGAWVAHKADRVDRHTFRSDASLAVCLLDYPWIFFVFQGSMYRFLRADLCSLFSVGSSVGYFGDGIRFHPKDMTSPVPCSSSYNLWYFLMFCLEGLYWCGIWPKKSKGSFLNTCFWNMSYFLRMLFVVSLDSSPCWRTSDRFILDCRILSFVHIKMLAVRSKSAYWVKSADKIDRIVPLSESQYAKCNGKKCIHGTIVT